MPINILENNLEVILREGCFRIILFCYSGDSERREESPNHRTGLSNIFLFDALTGTQILCGAFPFVIGILVKNVADLFQSLGI
jgi:hypothetical protein